MQSWHDIITIQTHIIIRYTHSSQFGWRITQVKVKEIQKFKFYHYNKWGNGFVLGPAKQQCWLFVARKIGRPVVD